MSSDIQKLRRLAQAALVAPDGLSAEWMDRLGQFQESVSPSAISELLDRLEAAERERDALRTKVEALEKREPVGVMYVGSYYGYELPEWEFDADQCACDKLNEAYANNPTTLKLYAIPDTKGE